MNHDYVPVDGKLELRSKCVFVDGKLCRHRGGMIIYVKTAYDFLTVDVKSSDTIESVKTKIYEQNGTSIDDRNLFFGDMLLEDDHTLLDYKIKKGSAFRLVDLPLSRDLYSCSRRSKWEK